jgi:hypothetical protein
LFEESAFIGCLSFDGLLLLFDDIQQLRDGEAPVECIAANLGTESYLEAIFIYDANQRVKKPGRGRALSPSQSRPDTQPFAP